MNVLDHTKDADFLKHGDDFCGIIRFSEKQLRPDPDAVDCSPILDEIERRWPDMPLDMRMYAFGIAMGGAIAERAFAECVPGLGEQWRQ